MAKVNENQAKLFLKTGGGFGDDDWKLLELSIAPMPADPDIVKNFLQLPTKVEIKFKINPKQEVHTFIAYDGQVIGKWLMQSWNGGITWESVRRID